MKAVLVLALLGGAALAQEGDRVRELEERVAQGERRIDELEERLAGRERQHLHDDIEHYLEASGAEPPPPGHAPLALSADLIVGAGGSTAAGDALRQLQDGHHDPRRRGVTLQQLELSLVGQVEPFRAEAHLLFLTDGGDQETLVEIEEAFLATDRLPGGFALEAGFLLAEFGILNPLHPHAWDFVDVPVVLTRFFGPDGMRSAGVQVAWARGRLRVTGGVLNAGGEAMTSFRANDEVAAERAVGGRPFVAQEVHGLGDLVYLLRGAAAWELGGGELTAGLSGLVGPNYTGGDGRTVIYGVDLAWRRAHASGWPFVAAQIEALGRRFEAAAFDDGAGTVLAPATFDDLGLYAQVLYGFRRPWAAGFRAEWARGSPGAAGDPFRDERVRLALLLAWHASEHARLRLQVNFDQAAHLSPRDHLSLWIVLELGWGAHAEGPGH